MSSSRNRSNADPIRTYIKYARKFECRIRKRKQERSWRRIAEKQILDRDNEDL